MMKEDYDVQDDYINDFGTMDDYDDDDEDDFACYSTGAGGGPLCCQCGTGWERETELHAASVSCSSRGRRHNGKAQTDVAAQ